ncbi:MAG TPA: hypothetical protein V6C86_24350 [Oculatellaceae cyanobacterium]
MVNGRRKGNRAEADVVQIFKAWWGGSPWERRSMGYAGSDLIVPSDFPFSLEVKHVDTLKARHIFKPTKQLIEYWNQARDQAIKENRKPLLVAKIEGMWMAFSRPWDLPVGAFSSTIKYGYGYAISPLGQLEALVSPLDLFLMLQEEKANVA